MQFPSSVVRYSFLHDGPVTEPDSDEEWFATDRAATNGFQGRCVDGLREYRVRRTGLPREDIACTVSGSSRLQRLAIHYETTPCPDPSQLHLLPRPEARNVSEGTDIRRRHGLCRT